MTISTQLTKTIPIFLTSETMPECHQYVIVDGGVAVWTGSVWLSKIDDHCVIQWPVLWWSPLVTFDDELKKGE